MGDGGAQLRDFFDRAGDYLEEWQGVPVPVEDLKLQLAKGHPLAAKTARAEAVLASTRPGQDFVCGGLQPGDDGYEEEVVVNHWFSYQRHAHVYVLRNTRTGRRRAALDPVSPDRSMDRLTYWMRTVGAADAWKLEAEEKAQRKLAKLIPERHLRQYLLTGAFYETSPRSQLTYMFRRGRPTIAMTPRWSNPNIDSMRCLAVLCLHPIGFYEETWAGCLVPTDDVIAHLLLMRGDEAGFWKQANQHEPWSPEAGI